MVPPGTKAFMHDKPGHRWTWAHHGVVLWSINMAKENYRYHKAYIPATRRERICDMVDFFSKAVRIPGVNSTDAATHKACDLIT